ncbi:DUF2510 domain-containing protein [Microbacterium sp. ARD32]|uniref:DUF2510 domain-containing protein n=1 Tax=Microbacterium sp. ARD32 TaxID=2962577 RepID=UPI0028821FB8|nr:DUF2510 domain-containing protein [Microbacterium sp. ARD32]MDT0157754.1 DUF2510 domain-containing protein [Microbacterium sp. ARD32]
MAAQPGWYPAGIPGRERWWDGLQWTAYEREVAAPAAPIVPQAPPLLQAQAPQAPAAQSPQFAAIAQVPAPPMGWYAFPPSGQTRWWNGADWTAYKLKSGRPVADAYATEPPSMGWVLGGMFVLLGLLNLMRALVDRSGLALALVFFAIAAVWMFGAGRDLARRRVAAPMTAPSVDGALRPLPGEADAVGAGWYPVTGAIQRWWTGAQWAHYVLERGRVRPTHFGPRSYRVAMVVSGVLGGMGLLALVIGIGIAATQDETAAGVALIAVGAAFVLVGAVLLISIRVRRYALLLPPKAPPLR